MMNVWFLPYEKTSNPYQRLLATALEKFDVVVSTETRRPLFAALRARWRGELDIIHFHWTSPFLLSDAWTKCILKSALFILSGCVLKIFGVKLVWTVHNLGDHEGRFPQIETLANRILCRLYDRIIVHCPSAVQLVQQTYDISAFQAQKIACIPHGHYLDPYPQDITRTEARQRLSIRPEQQVFLFFGQIRPYKNIPALIRVFSGLEDQDVMLLIVGDPRDAALYEEINKLSAEDARIRFIPGFVDSDLVQHYFNAADIVVLPFKDSLTSGTVLLAMSFGKAIITPALGCASELLRQQNNLLYDPRKQDGLFEALRRSQTFDLAGVGEQNAQRARAYSWDRIAAETHAVYAACLDSRE